MTNPSLALEPETRRPLDTVLVAGTHYLPTDRRVGVPFIPPSRHLTGSRVRCRRAVTVIMLLIAVGRDVTGAFIIGPMPKMTG
jgi:hypothetical protein